MALEGRQVPEPSSEHGGVERSGADHHDRFVGRRRMGAGFVVIALGLGQLAEPDRRDCCSPSVAHRLELREAPAEQRERPFGVAHLQRQPGSDPVDPRLAPRLRLTLERRRSFLDELGGAVGEATEGAQHRGQSGCDGERSRAGTSGELDRSFGVVDDLLGCTRSELGQPGGPCVSDRLVLG